MESDRVPLPPKKGDRGRLAAGGDRSHERKKGSGTAVRCGQAAVRHGRAGRAERCDLCASANLSVGMVRSTYPQSAVICARCCCNWPPRTLRRSTGSGMPGCAGGSSGICWRPYNPRLPLVGDRVMLLGDAAGLINPLNGEVSSTRCTAPSRPMTLSCVRPARRLPEGLPAACASKPAYGHGVLPAHRPGLA